MAKAKAAVDVAELNAVEDADVDMIDETVFGLIDMIGAQVDMSAEHADAVRRSFIDDETDRSVEVAPAGIVPRLVYIMRTVQVTKDTLRDIRLTIGT